VADQGSISEPHGRRPEPLVARLYDPGSQSREELRAYGRELRSRTPRSSHGVWAAASGRPDPLQVLRQQDDARLPGLLPRRYGRLLASPFAFFRGTPAIMAADLARTPRNGVNVQACGDCHLMNFGVFSTRTREMVCDLVDFDQTQPAPWEWDVKRLATSFVIAAGETGLPANEAGDAAVAVVRHYRGTIAALSTEPSLRIQQGHLRVDDILTALAAGGKGTVKKRSQSHGKHTRGHPAGRAAQTSARTQVASLAGLVRDGGATLTIAHDPPLVGPTTEHRIDTARRLIDDYRRTLATDSQHLLAQYRFADAADLVTGEADVGLETVLVLLQGRGDPDPLFLQVKRATASVLAPYAGHTDYARHGRRLVTGQRLTQAVSDPLLGWSRSQDGDRYVRHLRDTEVPREPQPHAAWFAGWARLCGATLARAHARSVDPAVLSGYVGGSDRFDTAIAAFAVAYAAQNTRDFEVLEAAVRAGRVPAEPIV